jgi:branched-chain amino acid transport system permease protein
MAILAMLPSFLSLYWLRLLTSVLMLAVIAQGMNAMAGFVGYPAFGNVVFFGIGAYGTALAIAAGFGMGPALLVGAIPAGGLALVVGPLLLALRRPLLRHRDARTERGRVGPGRQPIGADRRCRRPVAARSEPAPPAMPRNAPTWALRRCLPPAFCSASSCATARFGYGCRAISSNEEAAEATGVPALRVKSIRLDAERTADGLGGRPLRAVGRLHRAIAGVRHGDLGPRHSSCSCWAEPAPCSAP